MDNTVSGTACYNYYTPPNVAGSVNNYNCGPVATAVGQIMRYWQYPTGSVGTAGFSIQVSGTFTTAYIMGGDGDGGPYQWGTMFSGRLIDPGHIFNPIPVTTESLQTVGRLLHDVALTAQTNFSPGASYGSLDLAVTELVNTFHYSNAVDVYAVGSISTESLLAMITPSLDAGSPVCLGFADNGGYVLVCDGYEYAYGVRYNHLNTGWAETYNFWYTLPNVNTGHGLFSTVDECAFNIFPADTGEIISGRVTDGDGKPLGGVNVTAAAPGGATYTAVTRGGTGIYALKGIPASTQFTVSAELAGYYFPPKTVTTGSSTSGPWGAGNANPGSAGSLSGIDFVSNKAALSVVANPINGGTVTGDGTFSVSSSQQISATPDIGWTFSGWNDSVTTNPRIVTVPLEGASYTANFTLQPVAWINSPDYGSTLWSESIKFTWTTGGQASQYALWVGTTPNGYDIYSKVEGKALTDTVKVPVNGSSIYVTLWSMVGGQWQQAPSIRYTTWTAPTPMKARILSPPNNFTLSGGAMQLVWDGGQGPTQYVLSVGATPQGHDLYSVTVPPNSSAWVSVRFTDGRQIYATLWSLMNGKWQANCYIYNASPSLIIGPTILTSPAENSILPGPSATFIWSDSRAWKYALFVGSAPGKYDLYAKAEGLALSDTVTLPADGSPVYASIGTYTRENKWVLSRSYAYTTYTNPAPSGPVKAVMTSPANNSTLTGPDTTFTWNQGIGATQYALFIGSTPGGHDFYAKVEGSALSDTVTLPTDGRQLYVALLSFINGKWAASNYVYAGYSAPGSAIAALTNPAENSTFTGSSVTFTWSACSRATQYALFIGSTPGKYDIYAKVEGTALSDTVNIPTDGSPVYVAVWSHVNKQWVQSKNYTFQAFIQ